MGFALPLLAAVDSGAGEAAIVLSGAAEAAVALAGSPDLLRNEANYPHHLLTPEVTQVSEQWAGGLTVFVGLG